MGGGREGREEDGGEGTNGKEGKVRRMQQGGGEGRVRLGYLSSGPELLHCRQHRKMEQDKNKLLKNSYDTVHRGRVD